MCVNVRVCKYKYLLAMSLHPDLFSPDFLDTNFMFFIAVTFSKWHCSFYPVQGLLIWWNQSVLLKPHHGPAASILALVVWCHYRWIAERLYHATWPPALLHHIVQLLLSVDFRPLHSTPSPLFFYFSYKFIKKCCCASTVYCTAVGHPKQSCKKLKGEKWQKFSKVCEK